jgi:hypothetical protein
VLFNEGFLYTAVAKKNVRLLALDQNFFLDNQDEIDGLQQSILRAEKHCEEFGIPLCDFKKYSTMKRHLDPIFKFRRAV